MMQSTHLEKSGRATESGYRSTLPPTRQMQTDQVVLETFYKVVELVLQSRVHVATSAAPRNARLNFDMQEMPFVREAMVGCKANVHAPVFLDVYYETTLLERWQLTYSTGPPLALAGDFLGQLRKVVQQLSILLRSLFCLVRILPAYPVSTQLKFRQEDLGQPPVGLLYSLGTTESQMPTQFDVSATKQQYSFVPVDTAFGVLKVTVTYRKQNADVLAAIEQMTPPSPPPVERRPTLEHAIIQDYVPTTPQLKPSPLMTPTRMVVQEDLDSPADDHEYAVVQDTYYPTSQPMAIPHLTAKEIPSYPQQEPEPTKQAHSFDQPERRPRAFTKPSAAFDAMTKASATSFQTPPLHPNSAPALQLAPPRAPLAPLDGFSLDGKMAFRPGSADSDKSSSSSSQPPFSVADVRSVRPARQTPPFFSSSPPFRALTAEAPSASPQNVPATRIQFHPTRETKERRRSESFEVSSSAWGVAPSALELSLSPLLRHEAPAVDEASLPFALSSSTKVEVGSFLQQLKEAPPLHVASTTRPLASVEQELAYFRQLRDQMTHEA
ncbi:hypothetical protein ACHHYP_06609 [Achlya hypogyna]|uniref:Autophagy-related protein 13 N-terminal domain-containing protein n=1 Tax=Achlya hypogyna TaxID=1202772 RepID=A0A1V9YSL7_ACHHY|nr:hypothetical protein ACHHYP_06609 [Achlya hypogyna]